LPLFDIFTKSDGDAPVPYLNLIPVVSVVIPNIPESKPELLTALNQTEEIPPTACNLMPSENPEAPVMFTPPLTSSLEPGPVVPIPTLVPLLYSVELAAQAVPL